jgi:hypothetical protein
LLVLLVRLLLIRGDSILDWGTVVRTVTVGMVQRAVLFSGAGVAAMGSVEVTTLHPRGLGEPELPRVPESVPSLLEDSSWAVCKDGDPLCTIATNIVLESHSWGERLK